MVQLLLRANEGDLSIRDSGANTWGSGVGEADAGHLDDAAAGRSTSVSKPPLPTVTSKSSQENGAASPTTRSPPKVQRTTRFCSIVACALCGLKRLMMYDVGIQPPIAL